MQEVQFDAVLKNIVALPVVGAVVWGEIYEDKAERFPDGTFVRTSTVMEIQRDVNTDITYVKTKNTVYKLVL